MTTHIAQPQVKPYSIHHHFLKRELVYIYFQSFRKTQPKDITLLSNRLDNVLSFLKNKLQEHPHEYVLYLKYFYILMGHVRAEKGEHEITYMMIYTWHRYFPTLTMNFIQQLVLNEGHDIQLGCWRDMKYLCEYVHLRDNTFNHPIISMCIFLMNEQLAKDLDIYTTQKISNVAKWIPREHKKFDWLYTELVIHWFSRENPFKGKNKDKAIYPYENISFNKYKKIYRKKIAMLNKLLDTTQIKQCSQDYSNIIPNNINKMTYTTQPSLMYSSNNTTELNTKREIREKREQNRQICRDFSTYNLFEKRARTESIKDDNLIKQKKRPVIYDTNIPISYYIKEAFALLKLSKENNLNTEITHRISMLNYKWESLSQNFVYPAASNKYIIPLLDTSFTMQKGNDESYYTAIGIAILLSQISLFGKRIICIDHLPTWLNIEHDNSLIEIIRRFDDTTKSSRFTFSNMIAAIDLLVYSIKQTQLDKESVKKLHIVILSDFNQTSNDIHDLMLEWEEETQETQYTQYTQNSSLLYNKIREKFAGIEHPTIVFWNLSKDAFVELPCSIYQENALLLSGFSALQIKNIVKYKNNNPYNAVCSILESNKYNVLSKYVDMYML